MAEKHFWMPCVVNKNPAAATFPAERVIHYRFPDRHKAYWAIVQKRNVLEGAECTSRGNDLNPSLFPALFLVHSPVPYQGKEPEARDYCFVYLGDIDNKWILLRKEFLFCFTEAEAVEHLRNPEWTKEVFGEQLKLEEGQGPSSRPVLDLRIGLLKKD